MYIFRALTGQSRDSGLPIRGGKRGTRYDLGSERNGEHLRYITQPWFQDDIGVVRPEFQACRSPTRLTDASANSRTVFNESTLKHKDCNVSNGGPIRALSMVGKSQGGTVRGRGGFVHLALRKNVIISAYWSASNRGMESRYGCRVNFDGGWGTLFIQHLLQKWKNHWHIGGDRVEVSSRRGFSFCHSV